TMSSVSPNRPSTLERAASKAAMFVCCVKSVNGSLRNSPSTEEPPREGHPTTPRAAPKPSVPEVARPREDHGEAEAVRGRDHVLVLHRAARLDDGRDALLRGELDAVREGEEGVARERGAARALLGLAARDVDRVDARREAAAHADERAAPGERDRVRAD